MKEQKINYELLEKRFQESGEPRISNTDPDSRALLVQGQVVEVRFNIQPAEDDKLNLVVINHAIYSNDCNILRSPRYLLFNISLSFELTILLSFKAKPLFEFSITISLVFFINTGS